jgi:FkbM family methyltransferase
MNKSIYIIKFLFFVYLEHGFFITLKFIFSRLGIDVCGNTFVDENKAIFNVVTNHNYETVPTVMVDVGAHHGLCSIPFLKSNWKVIAFEPSRNNFKICQKRLIKWDVDIDKRALSSEEKDDVTFFESSVSSGIAGLMNFDQSHTVSYSVPVTTLSKALLDYDQIEIGYLKIDTEGNDLNVLKGINFDKQTSPQVILVEFEDNKSLKYGYSTDKMIKFLSSKNYQVAISAWNPITQYGRLHSWNNIYHINDVEKVSHTWGNLIAAKSSKVLTSILSEIRSQAQGEVVR